MTCERLFDDSAGGVSHFDLARVGLLMMLLVSGVI